MLFGPMNYLRRRKRWVEQIDWPMLIFRNLYFRPEIGGVSSFDCRLFSSRSKWSFSCWSMCDNTIDLTGMHDWRFQAERKYQGFRDKEQIPRLMETKLMNERNPKMFSHISDYDTVMEALSSLITRKKRGDKSPAGASKTMKLERMLMYVKILGLEEHIADLKIIHVAGTKGKGSTCTFCEAILRECGFKTGLFTSPHLIDVRERFRLDGIDISEEKFLHYFKECWHNLKKYETAELPMPRLFEFLTVMALKIFVSEKVDVAIIEVGLGGTRDSTNVIKNPIVCGVTPLGMDHMESLGDTLGEIASHKAGIFKPQVPAFTAPQLSEAMDVLQEKAKELKLICKIYLNLAGNNSLDGGSLKMPLAPLEVVSPLNLKMLNGTQLSLSGDHQYTNAGLAVALCRNWLQKTGNWEKLFQHADLGNKMPEAFLRGLSSAHLPGRGQIVYDSVSTSPNASLENGNSLGDLIFYLDGAHSPESMEACASWFSSVVGDDKNPQPVPSFGPVFQNGGNVWSNGHMKQRKDDSEKISKQILLFNCMDVRDPQVLLSKLVNTCASSGTCFSNAIFVPSISTYNKVTSGSSAISLDIPAKDLTWQFNLQEVWEKMIHGKDSDVPWKSFEMKTFDKTPPQTFLDEDASICSPEDGHFACSAVVSSLPSTINWLRNYVQENPFVRIQVLVTGSLHLVGDVLKVLKG